MIVNPTPRLWLFPAHGSALEILIFGEDANVARLYALILRMAESWRGFDRVATIAQAGGTLGVRVTIASSARYYANPVEEGKHALRATHPDLERAISWHDGGAGGHIGTWFAGSGAQLIEPTAPR